VQVIDPVNDFTISLNSEGMGGAIFYACLQTEGWLCEMNFINGNSFYENLADDEGGAISWVNVRFNDDGTMYFEDNDAFYGSDIASYANELEIEFLSSNDPSAGISTLRRL